MKAAFADTFYYLALINAGDEAHQRALTYSRDSRVRLVTGAWIVMEIGDGLAARPGRRLLGHLVDSIRGDPRTRFLGLSPRILDESLRLYAARPDKAWSLTDCMSFVAMRRLGLSHALTGDTHFAQAGFATLLV